MVDDILFFSKLNNEYFVKLIFLFLIRTTHNTDEINLAK